MTSTVRLSIFGSCVSRDPLEFAPDPQFRVPEYIARISMAGLATPPLAFDSSWHSKHGRFLQRCAASDFSKDVIKRLTSTPFDYLMLDFIDERFDLLEVRGSLVSNIPLVASPGFLAAYGAEARKLPRLEAAASEKWREGLRRFFEAMRKAGVADDRIILHEATWALATRDADAVTAPLKPPYDALAPQHNALLESYFAEVQRIAPQVKVLRVAPEFLAADPNHKWSIEPFHYVQAYYPAFMHELRKLTGLAPVDV